MRQALLVALLAGSFFLQGSHEGPFAWIGGAAGVSGVFTWPTLDCEVHAPAALIHDCGTYVLVDGIVYGPGQAKSLPPLGLFYGQGVPADEQGTWEEAWSETNSTLGTTGLVIHQTDRLRYRDHHYTTTVTVENTGTQAKPITLWRAGDCDLRRQPDWYLHQSLGYGYANPANGTVACTLRPNDLSSDPSLGVHDRWRIAYIPQTIGSSYFEGDVYEMMRMVGAGQPFADTCQCDTYLDHGIGLSWNILVPAGRAVSVTHLTMLNPGPPPSGKATADFTFSTPSCDDLAVTFQGTAWHPEFPSEAATFQWQFPGGCTSLEAAPVRALGNGMHAVTVKATFPDGAVRAVTKTVPGFDQAACCADSSAGPYHSVRHDQPFSVALALGGAGWTYTALGLPPGANFDAATGHVWWSAGQVAAGRHVLSVRNESTGCIMTATTTVDIWTRYVPAGAASVEDVDRDGVADDADNCPVTSNRDQRDRDADGLGDLCDDTPCGASTSGAMAAASCRRSPEASSGGEAVATDRDGDGTSDRLDNCPRLANPGQEDADQDGLGDPCDDDLDGDGAVNFAPDRAAILDNCPNLPNADQADQDGDGFGDACRPLERTAVPTSARPAQSEVTRPAPAAGVAVAGLLAAVVALRRRR